MKIAMRHFQTDSKKNVSFVLRLWLEPREKSSHPEWRWHVQHVQSGEEAYFHRLAELLTYIERKSEVPPPQ